MTPATSILHFRTSNADQNLIWWSHHAEDEIGVINLFLAPFTGVRDMVGPSRATAFL